MWSGDYVFVLENLVFKDFKIRYRNMSLGIFWSLLNPLIMMGVLTFVLKVILKNPTPAYPVFLLCGLVPFNFFTLSWSTGTNCLIESAGLVKRVPVPRIVLPVASVLSNCVQLAIQLVILFVFALYFGFGINRYWLLLPVVWFFEIVFVTGLVMACSALDVYVRDMRYVVESTNVILFWLVPIFYGFEAVPARFRELYHYNPVAAIVLALRNILMHATPPPASLMWKLVASSLLALAGGYFIFRSLERRFYERL